MASLVLVHGAGSGPWVFDGWPAAFPDLDVAAVDLYGRRTVAAASMHDFEVELVAQARRLRQPLALSGWSMGGLVAMMAARFLEAARLVLLEPSPPGEVQGFDPDVPLLEATFDPEEVYGPFPAGIASRPESELARRERKRGISVPSLPCPTLVVHGDAFPEDRGRRLAAFYGAEILAFPGLDHWDLVLDRAVPTAVARRIT